MLEEFNDTTQQFSADTQNEVNTTEKEPTTTEVAQAQESHKEQNLRIMRERAEAAEKRAQELEFYVRQNMNQSQPSQKIEIEEDDFDVSDDTFIEGKHLKKALKRLTKKETVSRKEFEEWQRQTAEVQAEIKLKSEFKDFDAVVNKDNVQKLAQNRPTLYRAIMANQDMYDKGYAAYEMIKASGIMGPDYSDVDKRLVENQSKPKSASTTSAQASNTPLTRISDYDRRVLTPERKEQLLRQVAEAKMRR